MHTNNKVAKTFESNNIFISFYSIKGCSINIKVKFADPKGHRRAKQERASVDDPDYDENPDSDPFRELRKKMKQEQEKIRRFKLKMQQQKTDLLHVLSEQHKMGIPLSKIKSLQYEEKREAVKRRRQEENVKREKLKYWHMIKREVLKHKRMLAQEDARERYE